MRTIMLLLLAALSACADARTSPGLISGGRYVLGEQPDGNSVVFEATEGLVVVDSGRHPAHQARILAHARARGKPIRAIVNTHWHLDHSGGNAELRRVFPGARLYASEAVYGALTGFLARSLTAAKARLADPDLDEAARAQIANDMAAVEDSLNLIPDVRVQHRTSLMLGDDQLELGLAGPAATAGDVWVYHASSGSLVAGDLVVLPAPFFDTACAEGWRRALEQIAEQPFRILYPGHGPALSRPQFEVYQAAFGKLIDCAAGSEPAGTCAARWLEAAAPLLTDDDQRSTSRTLIEYYLANGLRDPARQAEHCAVPVNPVSK